MPLAFCVTGLSTAFTDPLGGTVSDDLGNELIEAQSARAFFVSRQASIDWRIVASLRPEADRLVGCDLNKAMRLADRASELASFIGDPLSEAFAEVIRARVLDNLGRHSESNNLYEKAASTMRRERLTTEAAIVQKQQLLPLLHLGRYDYALKTARRARRVLAKNEPLQFAQLEANVGNIYYRLDRYSAALVHYERARDILSNAGDPTMLALVDFNRSNVLADTDRPREALKLLEVVAAQFEEAGHFLQASQARFHIAYLEFLRGNYNTSLENYYSSRDRLAELGSTKLVAYCNLEIAELLLALNAFEEASENAHTARVAFEELEMPFELAKTALVHGLAAMGLGQFDQTRQDFLRAREVFASVRNRVFTAITDSYLAELAARRSDEVELTKRARSSISVFARHRLSTRAAFSRLLLARAAYQMGDGQRALRLARATLRSVNDTLAHGVVYQCHHLIGRIERDRNRPGPAIESFLRSVDAIEKMRVGVAADEFKATFLRDKIQVYEDAISACLDDGRDTLVAKAFSLVESSKSRALGDLLFRYSRSSRRGTTQFGRGRSNGKMRIRLQELIEEMNWYSSQAALEDEKGRGRSPETESRRRAVVRRQRQIASLFRRLECESRTSGSIQPQRHFGIEDLCDSLERDEVAVEYFIGGDAVSAFIASRAGFKIARSIASRRKIDLMLSSLRFQMRKFTYGSEYANNHLKILKDAIDSRLADLYEEIFAPIEAMIAGSRIIVIPHGPLHYLPFHALGIGGHYLIDRFEISYSPSAAVLKLCRARSGVTRRIWRSRTESRKSATDLVAVGVADPETPNIREEISALAAIFPDTMQLLNDQATRENLFHMATGARFLHIATHGRFQRDNPMFSFLELADCRLDFYGLFDLKLRAELVTLSACQTGINAVLPGDELHGLMRGFLYAGAPSLVTSLWSVNDRSTAETMVRMYQNIQTGDSKRSALRRAQLSIRDEYPHPYYWAPFVLIGSPN